MYKRWIERLLQTVGCANGWLFEDGANVKTIDDFDSREKLPHVLDKALSLPPDRRHVILSIRIWVHSDEMFP